MPLTSFAGEDTAWGGMEDFKRNLSHFPQTNSLAVGAQYLCAKACFTSSLAMLYLDCLKRIQCVLTIFVS